MSRTSTGDLLLVLSGHLYYIITNLDTSPTVSATADALTLSIYSRRIFMDPGDIPCLTKGNGMDPKGRMMTARTAGWGNVGEAGLVGFYGEYVFALQPTANSAPRQTSNWCRTASLLAKVKDVLQSRPELDDGCEKVALHACGRYGRPRTGSDSHWGRAGDDIGRSAYT